MVATPLKYGCVGALLVNMKPIPETGTKFTLIMVNFGFRTAIPFRIVTLSTRHEFKYKRST